MNYSLLSIQFEQFSSMFVIPGLPIHQSPCGFHSNVFLVIFSCSFLCVCPIPVCLCLFISLYIWTWFLISYSVVLLMVFGHKILFMCLRHRLTKVYNFSFVSCVGFQVSQPFYNTENTFNQKFLILLFV